MLQGVRPHVSRNELPCRQPGHVDSLRNLQLLQSYNPQDDKSFTSAHLRKVSEGGALGHAAQPRTSYLFSQSCATGENARSRIRMGFRGTKLKECVAIT